VRQRLPVRMLRAATVCCVLACLLVPPLAAEEAPSESQVKAAFLFNFVKFIEWPADSFRENGGRMRLCVLGDGPLRPELERVAGGKTVNGHLLEVARVSAGDDLAHCRMLFVTATPGGALRKGLADLRNAPVLTVGESAEFTRQGGMIRFLMLDNRVRFEINVAAAEQAGLKISSKLLALAQNLRGGQAGGG